MDLLGVIRILWRHKIASFTVLGLVFVGVGYIFTMVPPVYEAKSSYVLVPPPGPPTREQIARDPSLADVHTANPYTTLPDQSIVVAALCLRLSNPATHRDLLAQGVQNYTAAPSVRYGQISPIVEITGTGSSARSAVDAALAVDRELAKALEQMQSVNGTDPRYMIKSLQIQTPDEATMRASSRLRSAIAVVAVGVILLYVVISVADAVEKSRAQRWRVAEAGEPAGGDGGDETGRHGLRPDQTPPSAQEVPGPENRLTGPIHTVNGGVQPADPVRDDHQPPR